MLALLQTGTLSRWTYLLALVALLAFDFSKTPITRFLEQNTEAIQQEIVMSDGAVLRQKFEDATRRVPTARDNAERERIQNEQMGKITEATSRAVLTEAKRFAVGSIFISMIVVLGVVSYLMLIWMVFARLRDAEWPAWVGFAILAIPLSQRFLYASMSDLVWDIMRGVFITALLALALLPSKPNTTNPMPTARPITSGANRQASFGKRGR